MDLYEALKEGATEEELLTAFKKELAEVVAQLRAEEDEIERQEALEDARWDLANALLEYMSILFNDDSFDDITDADVYDVLSDLEEMNYLESLCGILVNMDSSKEEQKPSAAEEKSKTCSLDYDDNDWEIIASFITNL